MAPYVEPVDPKENYDPKKDSNYISCLDHGFVRLVEVMGDDASIVQAARVSYGKGAKSVRADRGLIFYLMQHQHTTPFEMVEFKFHCVGGKNRLPSPKGFLEVKDSLDIFNSHDGEEVVPVTAAIKTGRKEVYRYHLERGYYLDVTNDHRVFVLDRNGDLLFKPIGELKKDDYVTLSTKASWYGGTEQILPLPLVNKKITSNNFLNFPKTLIPRLAELIGFYMGDGYLSHSGLEFPVGYDYPSTLTYLCNLIEELFGIKPKIQNDGKIFRVRLHSRQLAHWWQHSGFKKDSARNLKVPAFIWASPSSVASSFLRGLFTADGTVSDTNGVALTTACKEFAQEIQQISHALGVPLSFVNREAAYQLYTWTPEGIKKYSKTIGFWEEKKQARLVKVLNTALMQRSSAIPNATQWIRNRARVVIKKMAVSHRYRNQLYMECRLSQTDLLEGIQDGYFDESLSTLTNWVFLKCVGKNSCGIQDVYDFTVPKRERFLINSVVVHNCKMPIFVARQWIRHRTANVNEVSGRYSVMEDTFWTPTLEDLRKQSFTNRQGSVEGDVISEPEAREIQKTFIEDQRRIYDEYQHYLNVGVAREVARANLPLSIYTEWYWKIDLHNLLHFLQLRLDPHAQKEIRAFAEAMARFVKQKCPIVWESFEEHILFANKLSKNEGALMASVIEKNNLWPAIESARTEQLKKDEASPARIERELADLKKRLLR